MRFRRTWVSVVAVVGVVTAVGPAAPGVAAQGPGRGAGPVSVIVSGTCRGAGGYELLAVRDDGRVSFDLRLPDAGAGSEWAGWGEVSSFTTTEGVSQTSEYVEVRPGSRGDVRIGMGTSDGRRHEAAFLLRNRSGTRTCFVSTTLRLGRRGDDGRTGTVVKDLRGFCSAAATARTALAETPATEPAHLEVEEASPGRWRSSVTSRVARDGVVVVDRAGGVNRVGRDGELRVDYPTRAGVRRYVGTRTTSAVTGEQCRLAVRFG